MSSSERALEVLYLLLVGHNPFNQALKQPNQEAQDQEVLRLVALGQYNTRTERWQQLHPDAQNLVERLLRTPPLQRHSPTEALQHPFVTKRTVAGRVSGYGGHSSAIATCHWAKASVVCVAWQAWTASIPSSFMAPWHPGRAASAGGSGWMASNGLAGWRWPEPWPNLSWTVP